MKRRRRVYCEYRFLKDFLKSRPDILEPSDEGIRLMDNWVSMYGFISKSDLVVDITPNEFQKERNESPWLAMLWKKAVGGECGLRFEREKFPRVDGIRAEQMGSEILNAIFLVSLESDVCKNLSEKLGIIILNTELAKDCFHLFGDNGTAFPSEFANNWDFMVPLLGVFPPISICNTLMVVDNYLLTSTRRFPYQDKVNYNLKPILSSLLPQMLASGELFQIVLFCECDNIQEQYDFIRQVVRKLRPNLQFKLTLFSKCSRAFHDRSIVTNNLWIGCGHGFDVFRKNGSVTKSTNVSIVFPFIQSHISWADNSFLNLLDDAQTVYQRFNDAGNSRGDTDRMNRICDYYCEKEDSGKKPVGGFTLQKTRDVPGVKIVGKIDLSRFAAR